MNCPKQQCISTLVCRLLDSFIHLFGVAMLRFDSLVRSTTATIAFCQCQCKCCYSLQGSTWRLSVCLSVCLVATSRTNNHRIFTKLLRVMYLWTRKNLLNFGSQLRLDPDPQIFLQKSSTMQNCAVFYKLIGSSLKFYQTRKSLSTSGSHSESRSGPDSP